jgi:hypothetical protein
MCIQQGKRYGVDDGWWYSRVSSKVLEAREVGGHGEVCDVGLLRGGVNQ